MAAELPGKASAGEWLPAGGPGGLEDPHAHESNAEQLIGQLPSVEELSPDWVIRRLMIEATDRGTRSRQTARVAALGMLAKVQGLLDDGGLEKHKESPLQRALNMPADERRRLIAERVKQMLANGTITKEDLDD